MKRVVGKYKPQHLGSDGTGARQLPQKIPTVQLLARCEGSDALTSLLNAREPCFFF